MKQKASAKIHRRYVLIDGADKKKIEEVILDGLGTIGWAKLAPLWVNANGKTILAVKREGVDELRAAFELSEFKGKIKRVSGTLNGLRD